MLQEILTPINYVVGIFLVLFLGISTLCLKMDTNAQSICNDAVVEFVDKARAAGYISAESYTEMMQRINSTNNLYDVTIQHESKTPVPQTDESGNASGKVVNGYDAYYQDEILGYIFAGDGSDGFQNYPLKNGDYLQVTYELKEPTFATRLVTSFTTHTPKTIYGSYGGYVGSTEEDGNAY